jgi:predicted Holliday junction resolvase-like endonuclease
MRTVRELVDELKSDRRLRVECPHCGQDFPLRQAAVFPVTGPLPEEARELVRGIRDELRRRREELKQRRRRAREAPGQARVATEMGQALEALVPRLQDRLHPRDWRRLGDPIDFVVFDGLSATGRVQAVRFVEVKTGRARLGDTQQMVREAVQQGKVRLEVCGQEGEL